MDRRSFSVGVVLIVSVITVLASLPIAEASEYTPERLSVTVYSDGWTRVDFTVSVDPLLTSVDVSLLGDVYENMVAVNEEGVPLDFQLLDGSVQVDTVGSLFVLLSYDTLDLTSKEGRAWTIAVNAPISFILRFSEETTILDLSSVPESITAIDGRYVLTMSAGPQSLSYIVGIVGSKDQAELLIEEAQQSVDEAEAAGADVSEAESTLQEAKDAFEEGRFSEAERLAMLANEQAEEGLRKPREGVFLPPPLDDPLVLLGLVTVPAVVVLAYLWRRPRGREVQPPLDVEPILQAHPNLRFDEREVIKFLAAAGGAVVEAEIREKFRLAKSSTWRMMKRLEKQGIIQISTVRGQNMIRLRRS